MEQESSKKAITEATINEPSTENPKTSENEEEQSDSKAKPSSITTLSTKNPEMSSSKAINPETSEKEGEESSSKTEASPITKPSTKNPEMSSSKTVAKAAITEHSTKNPEKSFSINVTRAEEVKDVITILCHPNLNPQGTAMLVVRHGNGITDFRLAVRNQKTNILSFLDLNPSCPCVTDFQCTRPLERMIDNLYHFLCLIVDHYTPDDTINIFHLHGSSQLSFAFGKEPDKVFNVALLEENADNFERPPDEIVYCGAANLSTEKFGRIIPFMLTDKGVSRHIRTEMSDKAVNIEIGLRKWDLEYAKPDIFSGMSEGQRHCAWMVLPHVEVLKELCSKVNWFYMAIVTDPADSIIFQFGRLAVLKETTKTYLNYESFY